jgi:hypothetical protein
MQTYRCHQVPYHPFKNLRGLHIIVKQGHVSRNVGLQQSIHILWRIECIIGIEAKYGKAKMTCHL